ncbi:hypothetical protein FBU59_002202 [Linderina macrospora]|uniref:Uncharacterized protein n=1 Tax=Linderina macrospora TaxID=4868 RepID=A0ACC1JC08_9FUNG|nr:hypothetical protein FBU59_002202 [Linderina macrospora]
MHPFTPSPFEASRTLMPWMCVALEVLHNKAISPTVLVRSVLTPRRMLRTRALLDSLTGRPALADCRSSSGGSALSIISPTETSTGSVGDGQTSHDITSPPPAHTQAIITALVQILTESPPSHNWTTVSLAALLLAQLAAGTRNQIILDDNLTAELIQAQAKHSAEIRAMLLSADEPSTSIGDVMSNAVIGCGSWKALVKCLVDLANSSAETLRNKVESESRHIFSLDRLAAASLTTTGLQSPQMKAHSAPRNRRSSASSSTFNPPPPLPPRISLSSSRTSLATAPSPFDSEVHQDTALLAAVYQAHYLKRLAISASKENGGKMPPLSNYSGNLMRWLGKEIGECPDDCMSATVIDNLAKRALPKGTLRLGFPARVVCTDGHLLVYHQDETTPELVWPLADVTVITIDTSSNDSSSPLLRIVDTEFPDFFFAPRPKQLGGINVNAGTPTTFVGGRRRGDSHRPKLLPYSYVSSRKGLDISMRFADKVLFDSTASALREGVVKSRKALAGIYLNHSVI